jgi:hypothetical protein
MARARPKEPEDDQQNRPHDEQADDDPDNELEAHAMSRKTPWRISQIDQAM